MSSDAAQFEEQDFTTNINRGTILRILGQVRPYWRWVLGFMVSISLVSVIEATFNILSMRIIDDGIIGGDRNALVTLFTTYGVLMAILAALVYIFIILCGQLGERVQYDMRKKMFNHMQTLSFSYFDRTPVGWLMSRVTSDSSRISDLVTWGMLDVTWAVVNITTALIFMSTINWQLTLVVMALLPFLLRIAMWFQVRILVQFRDSRKHNSKITGALNENITGVRVVKAVRREEQNLKEFNELSGGMYRSAFKAAWLSALFLPVVQMISAIAVISVIWIGGLQVPETMSIGAIQAFVAYITFMMWPVQDLARVYAQMQQAVASAERVFALIDTPADIVDRPNATDPGTLRGEIKFENVEFYYEKEKPVLVDFNLTVRAGETIALVGPTGHGKSTIVNLLCRFYEPRGGKILINGQDYLDMPLHAIHSRVGMVLQTPHLFSGTIRENIRYGRLNATDSEIEAASKLAGAHDFIITLDKGYDEEVGEGGVLLSVGQKQLLSLARAILSDPELFIMDEATSSVDTLTEALIQQGMDTMMQGRTSFVIAHRLSTIRKADRILVIENGRISEMGTHAELIRQKGHYYDLYTNQFKQELEAKYTKAIETGEYEAVVVAPAEEESEAREQALGD